MTSIDALITEAAALADPFSCALHGHKWVTDGGRHCPENLTDDCSQTVYRCKFCGAYDYGYPGGPGHQDCESRVFCTPDALENLERINQLPAHPCYGDGH